jgi:mRNA interferase MazF
MAYASGDIVLVPFPYTDLSAVRTRPAVVVSTEVHAQASGDLLIAMVTGQRHDLPTDYALRDWRPAGLLLPSWVRSKLATVSESMVRFSPGRLTRNDFRQVQARLSLALGLRN